MTKVLYDELIDFLKRKKPMARSVEGLNDKIMLAIQKNQNRNLPYISLRANEMQWNAYRIFRVITTTAAAFLVIFLIKEQWKMNRKLDFLAHEPASSQVYENMNKYPSRFEMIQHVLYEFHEDSTTAGHKTDPGEVIRINRKSLNFLLNKIQELEKENLSYRTKLLQTYSDTTQFTQK